MSNNKYIVLPGGKECRAINPFDKNADLEDNERWKDFAKDNPTIPLTEVMSEGEFTGQPIDQYFDIMQRFERWANCDDEQTKFWAEQNGLRTRIAIKPLKVKETVKDKDISEMTPDEIVSGIKNALMVGNDPIYKDGFPKEVVPIGGYSTSTEPRVDVVENKERVSTKKYKPSHIQFLQNILIKHGIENIDATKEIIDAYHDKFSASWHQAGFDDARVLYDPQQSNSIEGIVGFVLKWVADRTPQKWIAGQLISSATKHDILNMKSDIIKELKK